jgi:cysteine desulfurase
MTIESVVRRHCREACSKPTQPVYLDWNSTSPPHSVVLEAMQLAARHLWANPSSVHAPGRQAKELVESVRELIARLIGANYRDLAFTSSGTEANNWALHDAPGLVLSRLEHPSVTKQGERLADLGRPVRWLEVPRSGEIDPSAVASALASMPRGTLVTAMAVNHETGVIQPLEAIAAAVRDSGAFIHVDAVQALGKLPPSAWSSWDSVAITAHKIRGPKGIAALAWKGTRPIPSPILFGGGQERGLRPGTVDPVLVAGFGAAIERLPEYLESYGQLARLRDRLESGLADLVQNNVPDGVSRLGHVSSMFVSGWPAEELAAALDLEGLCVSSGSACAAGTAEASPVIASMYDSSRARSTLRVSLGETTTQEEIALAIEIFRRVLARL